VTFIPDTPAPSDVQILNTSTERTYSVNSLGKPAYEGNGGKRGRKPAAPLPQLFDPTTGKLVDQYTKEKRLGIRKETGALKLKKLTFRHRKIIALHIQGFSGPQIAFYMNCSEVTVSRVLNDPLAKSYIDAAAKDREAEVKALMGSAVQGVREGLTKEGLSIETRLKAVDRYAKLQQAIDTKNDNASAEDVIAKMLDRIKAVQVNQQVNVGTLVQVAATPTLPSISPQTIAALPPPPGPNGEAAAAVTATIIEGT